MRPVNSIMIEGRIDPELMGLVNRFASVQQLKPTTAIKRFLLRTLPQAINNELSLRDDNQSVIFDAERSFEGYRNSRNDAEKLVKA